MKDKETIADKLYLDLNAKSVEIEDQSHLHKGHPGAASGGGHYDVRIISSAFIGLTTIERHRLIYNSLSNLMKNEIHALSIKAFSPDEVS